MSTLTMQPIQTPFFTLTVDGSFVVIESTGQAHAQGQIRLNRRDVTTIFQQLRNARPQSYTQWADAFYPDEADLNLLRIDDCTRDHFRQLVVKIWRHPSSGSLSLGNPDQEAVQLRALLDLEELVARLLEASRPDAATRARVEQRARSLLASACDVTFLPPEGYCYRCSNDVTQGVTDATGMTGCPVCGVSWCD